MNPHKPSETSATHQEKLLPASFLPSAVMALATAWSGAGPLGLSVDPGAAKHPQEVRENIAEAVRLLADNSTSDPDHKRSGLPVALSGEPRRIE